MKICWGFHLILAEMAHETAKKQDNNDVEQPMIKDLFLCFSYFLSVYFILLSLKCSFYYLLSALVYFLLSFVFCVFISLSFCPLVLAFLSLGMFHIFICG